MPSSIPPSEPPRPPPDAEGLLPAHLAEARDAILRALHVAARDGKFEDPQIRDAVAAYAERVRAAGHPPEWLIVDLKRLIASEAAPDIRDWFRGVLRDRLVSWGITGYFRLPRE